MRKSRQSELETALKQIINEAEKALSEGAYSAYQIGKQSAWAGASDIAKNALSGRKLSLADEIDFC